MIERQFEQNRVSCPPHRPPHSKTSFQTPPIHPHHTTHSNICLRKTVSHSQVLLDNSSSFRRFRIVRSSLGGGGFNSCRLFSAQSRVGHRKPKDSTFHTLGGWIDLVSANPTMVPLELFPISSSHHHHSTAKPPNTHRIIEEL